MHRTIHLRCSMGITVMYAIWAMPAAGLAAPEAIEVGADNTKLLPGGREADGIIGDFVIRNDRIEAVVSGNLHQRRPNLGGSVSPGFIYDLAVRGSNNDQLTWFAPGQARGQLSSVRVLKDGADGEAIVRAELTTAAGDGLGRIHDYILRDGWRHLVVVSTYHNAGGKAVKIKPAPDFNGLTINFGIERVTVGHAIDAADRLAYGQRQIEWPGAQEIKGEVELAAGASATFAVAVTVGNGSTDVFGVLKGLDKPAKRYRGKVVDADGKPAPNTVLLIPRGEQKLIGYVSRDGTFDFLYPDDECAGIARDLGRADTEVKLKAGDDNTVTVPVASAVQVTVTDDAGGPLPCKVQFIGIGGTQMPDLGPIIRAHGCDNQYQSENGRFTQAIPAGKYKVVVTRGIEYDHAERTIEVPAGKTIEIKASLKRVVDTHGWVSTDFHNHTTVSGDNQCGTDDRVINLAAENVEFAPTTEHNRLYDWRPHIERLGLGEQVATTIGIELTGSGPHLNAFPLKPEPFRQDNGAPKWDPDPRISALLLRRHAGDKDVRWVQLNHPAIVEYFNDQDMDGKPDGGFLYLDKLIDGSEMYGEQILDTAAVGEAAKVDAKSERRSQPFRWLQLLNAGHTIWTIATSDAHQVTRGGVGGWRTYVPSSSDLPAKIDTKEVITNAKAGHSFVTTGPFLEVKTSDGHGPGDTIVTPGPVRLHVRVQCNTWVNIDRVAVLVNGRIDSKLDIRKTNHPEMFRDGVLRFEQDIDVPLKGDAHLIVVAIGEKADLGMGYGQSWQAKMHPVAYHNPIFIDADGDGFKPNGDTLGQPYLSTRK